MLEDIRKDDGDKKEKTIRRECEEDENRGRFTDCGHDITFSCLCASSCKEGSVGASPVTLYPNSTVQTRPRSLRHVQPPSLQKGVSLQLRSPGLGALDWLPNVYKDVIAA